MTAANLLEGTEAEQFIATVSQQLNLPPDQARRAVHSVVPALVNGVARMSATRGGLAQLLNTLGSAGGGLLSENFSGGDALLGSLLGGERRADQVVQRAMQESGVSASILRQVLPMAAVFVMGWLFRNGGGALGNVLGNVLGAGSSQAEPQGPGGGLSLPKLPGGSASSNRGGGPLSMPDLDRIRRNRGDRPASDNPFPDLGDIITQRGGGGVAGSVRDILGGLLGFRTGGWIGWIIRFLVLRYGWRILGFIVRRLFLRA